MSAGQKILHDAKRTVEFFHADHHNSRHAKLAGSHRSELELIRLLEIRQKQLIDSFNKLDVKNDKKSELDSGPTIPRKMK